MMIANNDKIDLHNIEKVFKRAVIKKQRSIFRERLIPHAAPFLVTSMAAASTIFWDVWSHLPYDGQIVGATAMLMALVSSPFWNKSEGSLQVTEEDAIRAIDKEIDDEYVDPADRLAKLFEGLKNNSDDHPALTKAEIERTWDKWQDKIKAQKSRTGFGRYYLEEGTRRRNLSHIAIAFIFAISVGDKSDNLDQKWSAFWDFAPPKTPLIYTASITPPKDVRGASKYTDSMIKGYVGEGRVISPNDGSILSLTTYDQRVDIVVNGKDLVKSQTENEEGVIRYVYSIHLEPDIQKVSFGKFEMKFDIPPDRAPEVEVYSANPTDKGHIELQYSIVDDNGAIGATAKIQILDEHGEPIKGTILPDAQFPETYIPQR